MCRQLHPKFFVVRRRFGVKIGQFHSNVYVFFSKFHSVQLCKDKRACELYHDFCDKWRELDILLPSLIEVPAA